MLARGLFCVWLLQILKMIHRISGKAVYHFSRSICSYTNRMAQKLFSESGPTKMCMKCGKCAFHTHDRFQYPNHRVDPGIRRSPLRVSYTRSIKEPAFIIHRIDPSTRRSLLRAACSRVSSHRTDIWSRRVRTAGSLRRGGPAPCSVRLQYQGL